MAIIKLQNEGEEHTMTVTQCEVAKGNYGEQVKFSDGTDLLYLPKDTAERQLSRLGINYEECVGMTLTFSRDPNPKKGAKPYWGVSYAGAEPAAPKPSPRAEAPKAPSVSVNVQQRREAIVSQYLLLFQTLAHQMATIVGPVDAAAVQAATATVWISWKDKGIQPDGLPDVKVEAKPEPVPQVKMPAPSGKRLTPAAANEPPDFSKFPPPTDDDLPF